MSVLDGIIDSMATALTGITVANGYAKTVAKVYPRPVAMDNLGSETMPLLCVTAGGNTELLVEDDVGARFETGMTIMGFVRPGTLKSQEDILALAADVKRLINTDPNLGSACMDFAYIGESVYVGEIQAYCIMRIAVTYYCTAGSY